jgi:hypothetical protein
MGSFIVCTVHIIYSESLNVEVLKWADHVARMEEGMIAFKILTAKPTGTRSLGRPRRRWEDNIRMDLNEIGIDTRNWTECGIEPPSFISHGVN